LHSQGKPAEAVAHYRKALALMPAFAEAHNNLGITLEDQGHLAEAVVHYQKALALKPDFAEAHGNLGNALKDQGRLEEAVAQYRRSLALRPDCAEVHMILGHSLMFLGQLKEAVACYRKALELKPDRADWHSALLFELNYFSEDLVAITEEYRRWNNLHARRLSQCIKPHTNNRDTDRRLRVGYVSADFWAHSISYFLEPLLAAHDHAQVEVFCYSNGKRSDAATERFQGLADTWRDIISMNDDAVAELIRTDRIDILVDCSNHSAGNRLLVFARKPAPVQVSYGGSAMTTGLTTMDYRLTDRFLSPPNSPEWSSEELIRMPNVVACYRPPAEAPAVSSLPASANGYVTFGCFNNLVKVTPTVIALWSRILRALPEARLIMKDRTLADPTQRARYLGQFRDNGIEAERIELLLRTPFAEYLATYGRVDIVLDPFPYNGCTTTCEALWMGAPVVTLAGILANGCTGVMLLSNVGLTRLIAATPDEYVRIAVELAGNLQALTALRVELRSRMVTSSLCDAKGLAQAIEEAYRLMWRRWCRS
jgi:predicted O-linked N-acetylglucosamine transferase (SPINDLY family)